MTVQRALDGTLKRPWRRESDWPTQITELLYELRHRKLRVRTPKHADYVICPWSIFAQPSGSKKLFTTFEYLVDREIRRGFQWPSSHRTSRPADRSFEYLSVRFDYHSFRNAGSGRIDNAGGKRIIVPGRPENGRPRHDWPKSERCQRDLCSRLVWTLSHQP